MSLSGSQVRRFATSNVTSGMAVSIDIPQEVERITDDTSSSTIQSKPSKTPKTPKKVAGGDPIPAAAIIDLVKMRKPIPDIPPAMKRTVDTFFKLRKAVGETIGQPIGRP